MICCDFLWESSHTWEHMWFAHGSSSGMWQPFTSSALQIAKAQQKADTSLVQTSCEFCLVYEAHSGCLLVFHRAVVLCPLWPCHEDAAKHLAAPDPEHPSYARDPEDLNKTWLGRNSISTVLAVLISCVSAPGRAIWPNGVKSVASYVLAPYALFQTWRYPVWAHLAEDLSEIPILPEWQLGIKQDILGHLEWHQTPIFRHPNPTWWVSKALSQQIHSLVTGLGKCASMSLRVTAKHTLKVAVTGNSRRV